MDSDINDNSSSLESYLYWVASKCTDPVCYVHETVWRYRLNDSAPDKQAALLAKSLLTLPNRLLISVPSGAVGVSMRWVAAKIQKKPYLYAKPKGKSKKLSSNKKFTHLSWNICCVGAGYPISNGGVAPWKERIDGIVDQIMKTDADVNSIYETFDTDSAFYLAKKLRAKGYHCFYNIGPNALGTPSGIFIASKYSVANAQFVAFPPETLIGRTQYCNKGFFQLDLMSDETPFATLFATHLQHSKEPEFPTTEEIKSRKMQMAMLVSAAQEIQGRSVFVNGDLNLDDREYKKSSWQVFFDKGRIEGSLKTWGGDAFCANLTKARESAPLNLDHAMIVKGSTKSIHSTIIPVGFDGGTYSEKALSDHNAVYSIIELY